MTRRDRACVRPLCRAPAARCRRRQALALEPPQALCLAQLAAGRYEEALPRADRALGRNAGPPVVRLKLSLCGHLGRREEAAECLQRLRKSHAEPTIAALMRAGSKGTSPELAARIAEG